jgi:hypothetical protein
MSIGRLVMPKVMIIIGTAAIGACSRVAIEPHRSLAAAAWEFVQSLPDSICSECSRFYLHPEIGQNYDGPMVEYDGRGALALPYAAGHRSYADDDTLQVQPILEAEPHDGHIALACRIPAGRAGGNGAILIVEIYMSRGSQWMLEGVVVATGFQDRQGWSYRFREINWT